MFGNIKKLATERLKNKLSIQLIMSFLVMFTVIILISFTFLYSGIEAILMKNSENYSIQRFKQYEYNINSFCNEVDAISRRIVIDANLHQLVGYGNMNDSEKAYSANFLTGKFSDVLSNYAFIEAILYYGSDGLTIKSSKSGNFILLDSTSEIDWFYHSKPYKESGKNKKKLIWFGGYTDKDFGVTIKSKKLSEVKKPEYYISASRDVLSGGYSSTLVININVDYFTSIYNNSDSSLSEDMYIIDDDGKVISGKNYEMLNKKSDNFQLMSKDKNIEKFMINSSSGVKQAVYYRLASFGGILVSEIPMKEITKDVIRLRDILVILSIISLLLAFVLSRFWIYKLMRPLGRLTGIIQKIEHGNLGLTLQNPPHNELGILVEKFNKMSTSIKELFERNSVIEAQKRKLEMETLRSQINPHFIYNTLNTIKWMAAIKKEKNIVNSVTTLSDFLEPIFKKNDIMCTVGEEIEYIRNYVKIMNYRFAGGFKLEIGILEDCLQYKIIRFILQPIVENAIIHGLVNKVPGKISISMWEEEEDIFIAVKDNGDGISDAKLQEISELLNMNASNDNSSIGLVNVNRRIKLQFGEEYGLSVKNGENGGTEVILRMKVQKT